MAQQKSARKQPDKPQQKKETPPPPTPKTERFTVKPEFWESLFDSLPPWGDEIAAIVLIVFGIVSFLSLFNLASDATISRAWSNALTGLFGYGSVVVSGGILGLGVVILLPKLNITVKFPARRILALEIAFLSLLAILHLAYGDPELRALARAGQGGGYVGWALSQLIAGLLGSATALIFYGGLFVFSISVVLGMRRAHIQKVLQAGDRVLQNFAARMAEPPRRRKPAAAPQPQAPSPEAALPPTRRATSSMIVRVRFDPSSIPPSARAGAAPKEPPPGESVLAPRTDRLEMSFNAIGTFKGKKLKGLQQVERPDGRIKRYFTVADMKEVKRIVKRDPHLPPLELLRDIELNMPDEQEINTNVVLIENTLLEFDIDVDVVEVKVGPTVTQYAVQPFKETTTGEGETVLQRTRVSRIASLSGDLALALSAKRLRIEAPVPGHSYVGIEVPNRNPSIVALRSVYESKIFQDQLAKARSPLYVPLGRDVSGAPLSVDLAQMPHLLIAGTTGSGKSVCIAALTAALVLNNTPDKIKLIMLDPKMVELSRFNGLPHLLGPVETDQERIIGVLRWCTREMDRRYKLLEEYAARNIEIYNSRLSRRQKDEYLPYIVIMIDEIGDLMLSRPEETEKTITRIAQMARAVGMHLVVATQRPSVDVITGLIKANFPSRISFAVASSVDSRVILDSIGAENLLGKGDMLYLASDAAGPRRLQGCYVSDDEVRALVNHWKDWHEEQIAKGRLDEIGIGPWERGLTRREFLAETDPMLEQAIQLVIAEGEASASLIQRRLGLGYPRAARIMDLLFELGVVGEAEAGGRTRRVLIKPGQDPFKEIMEKRTKGK
ncbi:MAG: DNA translocase FtsK [Chloroflexota bacterium]|nr:MAG: DNA translocase FtsK [Chloroflexota bacterium]